MSPTHGHLGADSQLRVIKPSRRGRLVASNLSRCACRSCGSHVHALKLLQTISAICATCGSCDIGPLRS